MADTAVADTLPPRCTVVPYRFKPISLILPAALITAGAVGTAVEGWNDFHLLGRKESVRRIRVDDYMEWGMLGWVFVCDLMGRERHRWTDQLALVALAEGFNGGMTHGLKRWVGEVRPDGGPRSFPSGHTANAFLGAHMAYKEFKGANGWLAYSGYGLAVAVACSRIYNNRHWVADVVAGAGFGILSVELAYLVYFPLRNAIARSVNRRSSAPAWVFTPTAGAGRGGLYFSYRF